MNNYCTNCGKKLEGKTIKCDACNTYVIDINKSNSRKVFRVIAIILTSIVVIIIMAIIVYIIYYKSLSNSLYKKHLSKDYPNAKYVKYEACRECDGSCDGGCFNSPKVVGCYKYYYKSNQSLSKPDIIVFANRGKISIDSYSYIINKYGFENHEEEDFDKYLIERRNDISIKAEINEDSITKIYEMVNELINLYKEDAKENIDIRIFDSNYSKHINISNRESQDKNKFFWELNYYTTLVNPTLETLKSQYKIKDNRNSSANGGNLYND